MLYLSSADWMPRNLIRRVEVAFPVENPDLRKEFITEVFCRRFSAIASNRGNCRPTAPTCRLRPEPRQKASQAQLFFRQNSRNQLNVSPIRKSRGQSN